MKTVKVSAIIKALKADGWYLAPHRLTLTLAGLDMSPPRHQGGGL